MRDKQQFVPPVEVTLLVGWLLFGAIEAGMLLGSARAEVPPRTAIFEASETTASLAK